MREALAVARSNWRARGRAWIALGLLAGLGAGAVMTAAIGARRTETAYTRFNRAHLGADVVIEPSFGAPFADITFDQVKALPVVAAAARDVGAESSNGLVIVASEPPAGVTIDRPKVLEGRMPQAVGEAALGFDMARRRHLHVGSRLDVSFPPPMGSESDQPAGPPTQMTLRVVGIEAAPGEFPPHIAVANSEMVRVGMATVDALRDRTDIQAETLLRFHHGSRDLPAYLRAVRALAGDKPQLNTIRAEQSANVQRSFHLQAVALWLVAALLTLVTVGIAAQQLARQSAIDAADHPAMKALGATRRQLWTAGLVRAVAAGGVAAALATIVAILASPMTPFGTARIAEPHPGIVFDWVVLGAGALATVLFVIATAAVPLWRATSIRAANRGLSAHSPGDASTVTRVIGQLGLPLAMGAGIRMALQRGRGRTAVPVVSSLLSVVVAIAALVAAVTFGANLDHLLSSPRLYGWNWDVRATSVAQDGDANVLLAAIGDDPQIADMAKVDTPPLGSGRETFDSSAFGQVKGRVDPLVLEGRAPRAADEIVLGSDTMRRLKTHIGGTVEVFVTAVAPVPARFRVVGRAVVAPQSDAARLGRGAFIDLSAEPRMVPPDVEIPAASDLVIRFADNVDRSRAIADLHRRLGPAVALVGPSRPADLVNFGQVQNLPLMLAVLLAVLGAATLLHALVTSIRQRRRDLSVLKTLGFSSRQVRAAVAWQATAFILAAMAIGLPVGLVTGRLVWRAFVDRLGAAPDLVMPSLLVVLIVPAAIVVANAIAMLPGIIAGRLHPALVLRAD